MIAPTQGSRKEAFRSQLRLFVGTRELAERVSYVPGNGGDHTLGAIEIGRGKQPVLQREENTSGRPSLTSF